MDDFYILTADGTRTECAEEDVRQMWADGHLPEDTQYWREGNSEWHPLSSYLGAIPAAAKSAATPPSLPAPVYTLKYPLRVLTHVLVGLLFLGFVFEGVSIWSHLEQANLLGGEYAEAAAIANDKRQELIGAFGTQLFLGTAVLFSIWIYRANSNCWNFGATDMLFTPGKAVGCYFIPIVHLYRPAGSMTEIWRISRDPVHWKNDRSGAIVGFWWILWLLACGIGAAANNFGKMANDIEGLQTATYVAVLGCTVSMILHLVLIRLLRAIRDHQEQLVES